MFVQIYEAVDLRASSPLQLVVVEALLRCAEGLLPRSDPAQGAPAPDLAAAATAAAVPLADAWLFGVARQPCASQEERKVRTGYDGHDAQNACSRRSCSHVLCAACTRPQALTVLATLFSERALLALCCPNRERQLDAALRAANDILQQQQQQPQEDRPPPPEEPPQQVYLY